MKRNTLAPDSFKGNSSLGIAIPSKKSILKNSPNCNVIKNQLLMMAVKHSKILIQKPEVH